MSNKELDRATVIARLAEGSLSQRAAAEALGLTERQVRRLLRGYEAQGALALISKRRGSRVTDGWPADCASTRWLSAASGTRTSDRRWLASCCSRARNRPSPGAIVKNKLLSHTLRIIETAQQERDENRLASKRMTLHDKDKLRKSMGITSELHAHPNRVKKPPTYPPMQLKAAVQSATRSHTCWHGSKRKRLV